MRSKENRKFLVLCLLMLLFCTSCVSSSQNADGSPLEFFNRRVLENPEWTLKAVTELGKYRAESICSDGEHLYVLCREQNQILKLDAGALVRQAVLPYGYVATSAVPGDGRWYAVNSSFYSLDCFDSAWQYVSTGLMLANREKNVLYEGQSLSLARCKGQLMLLSTSSGTLYRVQENAHDAQ